MDATGTCPRKPATGTTRRRVLPVAVAVLVAATLALVVAGCGETAMTSPATQIDLAKNVAAKAEIVAVETGVRAYQAMNGRLPADASQATLGQLVSPWPKNPWTGGPMQPGTGKGDYSYAQTNDGFRLTVHLDGEEYSRP